MKKTFSILLLLSSFAANAQFFFNRIDSVAVIQNNAFLPMAFAGGQNFLVVSEIDLDFDGTKDLFLFDRSGDKISTFLNHGIPDSVSYLYAHDYIRKFPKLNNWALLRDFNCDGKEDIFASTNAARLEPEVFLSQIRSALAQAGRRVLLEHYVPQPTDFPICREEPAYLKTVWMRVA